jgi:hypothetical protein
MEVTYLCPHCRCAINADKNIVLSARMSKKNRGLVLLHEEIGNYSVSMSPSLIVKEGEIVDFYCPICRKSLNLERGEHLARIVRWESDKEDSYIIFSRKYGERITFKVDKDKQVESFGESLSRYIDPDWFL